VKISKTRNKLTKYYFFLKSPSHQTIQCVLTFNNNEPSQPEDPNLILNIDRIHNEGNEKNFKLLGVLFDEYLSFDDNISNLCAKISKSLFCLNRIKIFYDPQLLKMLFYAIVHSHISYCLNVYRSANTNNLQRFRVKQEESICIIDNCINCLYYA
jgi:hypothetical protein